MSGKYSFYIEPKPVMAIHFFSDSGEINWKPSSRIDMMLDIHEPYTYTFGNDSITDTEKIMDLYLRPVQDSKGERI